MRAVQAEVGNAKFVFKSDVKKYYASMDHDVLMGLVNSKVKDRKARALILKSGQGAGESVQGTVVRVQQLMIELNIQLITAP